jgi:hypothetical protein
MVSSNNSRIGYGVQADLQNRVQRMTVAADSIVAGEASSSSINAYDAGRIVEELVCRYLHCSVTTSGIFRF